MTDNMLITANDNNEEQERIAKFKPRARLLLQLGDQLIKNESIALLELAKNAYDADASKVIITMHNPESLSNGDIEIEDDGFGMTGDIVENVWLEPGSNFKQEQYIERRVTPKFKRLPIGEKGIGRFGAHKLGNIIEMTTKNAEAKEVYVRIDWTRFAEHKYLDEVPIKIVERNTPQYFTDGRTGTKIVIRGFRHPWERGTAREVKRAMTSITSPFETIGSFKPSFEIEDKPKWFDGILSWEGVREYSLFQFEAIIENNSISYFSYKFTPWATMTKLKERVVDVEDPIVNNYLRIKDEKGEDVNLTDHKIGKIKFKGFVFDQDAFVLKMGLSDKSGFKAYLKSNGGVRVFRDGLRVYDYGEPENDWLALDYRRFQQPTKAISNNLIVGAVELNREESSDLEEKTNREGFVANDAYAAFKNAVLHVIEIVEILRQTDKKKLKELYGPTPKSEPVMSLIGEAQRYVEEKVKDSEVKTEIKKYLVKIERDYKTVTDNLLKAAGAGLNMSVVVHEIEKIIYEVTKVLKTENASERALHLVEHLSSLVDGYADIIRRSDQTTESVVNIVNQALFNTEYRLEAHNIVLTRKYNDNGQVRGLRCKMARNLMISTVMNLIDNSIYWLDQKYFKKKEKKESFVKKIYIDIIPEDDFINIIVADNGTGILLPTEEITEPFVTGKKNGAGMGLGLHIASEVLAAQGGKISFPDNGDYAIPEEFQDGAIIVLSLKK
ncbi:MAG: sensor histidine kinase [Bacteroidales bacterium]|nr:sensor histidine kinase [Bacteroidales bacterium]